MAPTPSNTALPHANANATMHAAPRYDSWILYDDVDASIPREVRDQFQTDDKGHVLFFTAPPQSRPNHGVAEENATLGHSVRYLSGIAQHRAERERKRKERDEALRQQEADRATRDRELREAAERQMGAAVGRHIGDWILGMQHENEEMERELAPVRAQKAAWIAERDAMKQK
jgi:chromatin structure-remodeling complex subunit RSC1/2